MSLMDWKADHVGSQFRRRTKTERVLPIEVDIIVVIIFMVIIIILVVVIIVVLTIVTKIAKDVMEKDSI